MFGFSPDSRYLVRGTYDGMVVVLEAARAPGEAGALREVARWGRHVDHVTTAQFSPITSLVVSTCVNLAMSLPDVGAA